MSDAQATELFYFSGTGNSFFVAQELSKRIAGAKITSIVSCLARDACRSAAETVGIIFPVHALTIPIVIHAFIKRLEIPAARYIFIAATRYGTDFFGFTKIRKLLKRKKKRVAAEFIINMYNNDSRHGRYVVPTDDDLETIKRDTINTAGFISETVKAKNQYSVPDTKVLFPIARSKSKAFLIKQTVLFCMNIAGFFGGANYFYHDRHCNGCGICEKVCLSRKINMTGHTPLWDKHVLCHMCFACLNFCPKKAVQIKSIPGVKSFSIENGRYPHPHATIRDMEMQKT